MMQLSWEGLQIWVESPVDEGERFALGANNPPFAMKPQRMGHPNLWLDR
jgi:hypothetical protein